MKRQTEDALNSNANALVDALNIACARWLLFILFMPPLHRSQSMGKPSSSAREAGRNPLLSMALKPLRYAYENKTSFTVTPDTILPHPHSMSLATTIFEGPSESRQDLKATTPLTARNSKKTCRRRTFRFTNGGGASERVRKTLIQRVIHKFVT